MNHLLLIAQSRFALFASLALLGLPSSAQAKLIQILHTNDLHASLATSGAPLENEIEYGGWAQVKAVMDRLTQSAKTQGIETVRLDAGDFSEGTSFYFPDHGVNVLKTFQKMGYDAAALGNHDWLMGADQMNEVYGQAPFPFPILSANVKINSRLKNLSEQIIPSTQIVRGGIKIGVFGLSTTEALYKWITKVDSKKNDLQLNDYRDLKNDDVYGIEDGVATQEIAELGAQNDVVIALTHIGYEADRALAASSSGLDLIIGGHSHTELDALQNVKDLDGNTVPIVQTGVNGHFVGKIILEVGPHGTHVQSYELVPVIKSGTADPEIAQSVAAAAARTEELYRANLNQVLGRSEVRLVSAESGPTAFGQFIVDAMKESTGAELAVDVGAFHGVTSQPAGEVTLKTLIEMYPRKFEAEQNEGVYVYRARVPGWVIALAMKYSVKYGIYLSSSGITYDATPMNDVDFDAMKANFPEGAKVLRQYDAKNIKVNGEKLSLFRSYDVALPEALVRGAYGISPLMHIAFKGGYATDVTLWKAAEAHLKNIQVIRKLLSDDPRVEAERRPDQKQSLADFHREVYAPGEGIQLPWINELSNYGSVMDGFLGEIVLQSKKETISEEENI